jgi:threonine dehydrogenase-like Zn-dependent dehydrogenase
MVTAGCSRFAMLVAPGKIVLRERAIPVPGPHELLIRVLAAGICGTDLGMFSGTYQVDLPLVPGHEFCGTVVAQGDQVTPDWLNAFVTAEINVSCLSRRAAAPCGMCLASEPAHCVERRVLGLRGLDGAFADHLLVPVANAHRLPDDLPVHSAAIIEPLAAAIRTFELTPLSPGSHVVVLGAGRLGLLIARTARSHGAHVMVVSRTPGRLALASRFGAAETIEAGPAARETVLCLTGGIGADVVVECTGAPEGLAVALSLVRPRGVIAQKSTSGAAATELFPTTVAVKEITIQGSRCGPFAKAIERLRAGQVPVDEYVSAVFPLERIEEALRAAEVGTKVLIEPV